MKANRPYNVACPVLKEVELCKTLVKFRRGCQLTGFRNVTNIVVAEDDFSVGLSLLILRCFSAVIIAIDVTLITSAEYRNLPAIVITFWNTRFRVNFRYLES